MSTHSRVISGYRSLVGQQVKLYAEVMGRKIPFCNPNCFGDIAEDIMLAHIQPNVPEFRPGPKQASPDFFGEGLQEYEQKVFANTPCFDIGNFASYVESLCTPEGMYRKLFNTTYVIYRYEMTEDSVVIKNFWELPVWKLPAYGGKNKISAQVKRGVWYNLRPGTANGFSDPKKTVDTFLDALEEAMPLAGICPEVQEKVKAARRQVFAEAPPQPEGEQPCSQTGRSCCILPGVDSCLESLISELTLEE